MITNKGKKYKTVDKELIKKLGSLMCTYEEIGFIVGMSGENVKKRFKKAVEEGQAVGKESLRRAQFKKAVEAGDTRMLIFLGKNYLGQKDDPNSQENLEVLPWEEDK
tara:strand:+ start:780 stop:1100 length:321 start_codon:yes stop_codon:yes gene_type:complete